MIDFDVAQNRGSDNTRQNCEYSHSGKQLEKLAEWETEMPYVVIPFCCREGNVRFATAKGLRDTLIPAKPSGQYTAARAPRSLLLTV
jgi:hypothetical protein